MILTHLVLFIVLLADIYAYSLPEWILILIVLLPFLYFYSFFTLSNLFFKESEQNSKMYMDLKIDKIIKENEIVKKEIVENVQNLKNSIKMDVDLLSENLDIDQIKTKLDEAFEKYQWAYQTRFCENKIIDALLLNKMTVAKEKKIPMYIQVVVPEQIDVNNLDILSLFSNLIDNAIEANENLAEEKRFISVTAGTFVNTLYLCVENKKLESQYLSLENSKTIKKEKEFHGYGIQIVKKIVAQYSGYIEVENDIDLVRVKLFIHI